MGKKISGDRLLVLGSVTKALQGRDILGEEGIFASLERIKSSREYGCGYGLRVKERDALAAGILRRRGIKLLAVLEI